jgi:hypothetical protein
MSTSTILVSSVETSDVSYPAPESAVADPRDEFGLIAEAVLADHAELVRAAARLRETCTALEGTNDPVDDEPARLLEEFENELLPHFAAEELEECCGSLITEEPRLLGQLGRLQSEHTEIATALDELLEFARAKPPGGELATRLDRFLHRFEAHERAENALMQELVLLDEGTSGE